MARHDPTSLLTRQTPDTESLYLCQWGRLGSRGAGSPTFQSWGRACCWILIAARRAGCEPSVLAWSRGARSSQRRVSVRLELLRPEWKGGEWFFLLGMAWFESFSSRLRQPWQWGHWDCVLGGGYVRDWLRNINDKRELYAIFLKWDKETKEIMLTRLAKRFETSTTVWFPGGHALYKRWSWSQTLLE